MSCPKTLDDIDILSYALGWFKRRGHENVKCDVHRIDEQIRLAVFASSKDDFDTVCESSIELEDSLQQYLLTAPLLVRTFLPQTTAADRFLDPQRGRPNGGGLHLSSCGAE